jgi:hypothetical protein
MARGPGSSTGGRGVLRDWASKSYSKLDGRAASAIFPDGDSSQGWTRAEQVDNQIPSGFEGRDRRATQGRQKVKDRPTTQKVVD